MKENNLRKKNERSKVIIAILLLIAIIGVGYATLGANLRINGVASIPSSTWNVHFKTGSITPTNGSVTIDTSNNEQAATITNATQVSYAVTLALPGDFYEFTVQVENTGSIDAMIDSISSKLGTTEITTGTLPSYINYSVAYSDGTPIAAKQILAANGGTETIKVRIEFKTDIEANQLPGSATTLNLNFQINYVQADNTAVAVPHPVTTYTVNIFDGNNTTLNNGTNTSVVWLGQTIPNGITTYQTPALAMAAAEEAAGGTHDRIIYLKHNTISNSVTESYVEFVVSSEKEQDYGFVAGTYSLRGGIDEENELETPVFFQNAKALYDAFGGHGCNGDSDMPATYDPSYYPTPTSTFSCAGPGLYADIYLDGGVEVVDGLEFWGCGIDSNGSSSCTLYQ